MKKYLDPKNDLVFKKIFGEHPKLLISFLNALLQFDDGSQIVKIDYIPTELIPDNPLKKRSTVDVRCTDNYGRHFIVEMQMEWTAAFSERMLLNASKVYGNQIRKGEEYTELQPVYGLSILNTNANFGKKTDEWYHLFEMTNKKNLDETIGGIKLVLIELQKFTPKSLAEKGMAVLWLRFLKEMSEEAEIPTEFTSSEEISEAMEVCERAAYTDAELLAYDKVWADVSYERTLMSGKLAEGLEKGRVEGREEGLAEGLEKGLAEGLVEGRVEGEKIGMEKGKIEIAKELLKRGLSIADIIEITKLPENEIKKI